MLGNPPDGGVWIYPFDDIAGKASCIYYVFVGQVTMILN
jgi:hypothetical protein